LTEILISIFIMGVGLVSLATLFPLGVLRLREATRDSRSATLTESSAAQVASQKLFTKQTFFPIYAPLLDPLFAPLLPDPLMLDPAGLNRYLNSVGASFPVAYDPMFWWQVENSTNFGTNRLANFAEARFGNGVGVIRDDYAGGAPSAWGLPRITNFSFLRPGEPNGFDDDGDGTADDPDEVRVNVDPLFASIDDLVYQSEGSEQTPPNFVDGVGSRLVPTMTPGGPLADLMFTWMFTGRQSDVGNASVFDGDVVIFHNRPFGLDPTPGVAGTQPRAAGERMLEAIWGFGPPALGLPVGDGQSFYSQNDTTVLLRWPASEADPEVRVGSWIADVTYEGVQAQADLRYNQYPGSYPSQRCYWYRVIRRTDAEPDPGLKGDPNIAFKRMTVTVDRKLRAKTPLDLAMEPNRTQPAFFSPHVVNVYPKVFLIH
jgi:hypothetical protein